MIVWWKLILLGVAWTKQSKPPWLYFYSITLTLTRISIEIMIANPTDTVKTSKVVRTKSCLIITVIHVQNTFINVCVTKQFVINYIGKRIAISNSPSQSVPLPVNPGSHLHSKLPTVSVHVAFGWQLSIPRSHSSMSESIQRYLTRSSDRKRIAYLSS